MIQILQGDCREVLKTLPDCSVHCCVTSPPYFGLRDYGCAGQIGLESTPDAYVAELVAVFREAARLARKAARDAIPAKGTHDYYVWLLNKYAAENGEGIVRKIKPPQLCSLQLFDPFCHHPDYYIVGIMAGFLDLEFVAQWSAPIRTDEARVPFAKGVADVKSGAARLCDFAADLAKVRATAPRIFDAAVIRAHGRHKASTIIAQVVAAGCGKKLDGQFSKERLHKVYAQLRRMFA